MKHVVMFSGGVGSWAAAKRVAERHGTDDLTLLFSDTLIEDEDLYRFIDEAAVNVGGELVKITEGRDPWQVFEDVKFIGNTRIDPCSRILKRDFMRQYLERNFSSVDTTVYLGIDWTEIHRFESARPRWEPWKIESPMCEKPLKLKHEMMSDLVEQGLTPPRMYEMGFPHNNCGGFCIKAGQAHFKLLLTVMPDRYAYHESKEQNLISKLGKEVAILRDRRDGETIPYTLQKFREDLEAGGACDADDWGGCGCVVDGEEEGKQIQLI